MLKKISLFCSLIAIFVAPVTAFASIESSASNTTNWSDRWQNADWMSRLKEDTRLSKLSIPGTHDTAADEGDGYVRTQSLTIPKQLENGIRFLDIRARVIDGSFAIHHGDYYLSMMFGDVIRECKDFLIKHPGETVYMRLKQEKSSVSDAEFNKILQEKYVSNQPDLYYFNNTDGSDPSLGATKGKIVLMKNFNGDTSGVGIDYVSSRTDIQDYDASTLWEKTQAVNNQLRNSNGNYGNEKIYINYVSYWDWDDSNWGRAHHMNNETIQEMRKKVVQHAGIVVADYPGDQLINRTIDMNQKHLKNQATYYDGSYVVVRAVKNPSKAMGIFMSGYQTIMSDYSGDKSQKWIFRYISEKDAYTITNENDNASMLTATVNGTVATKIENGNPSPFEPIPDGQFWKIVRSPYYGLYGDKCRLVNVGDGKTLDIVASVLNPIGSLITYQDTGNDNQLFELNQD